MLAGPEPGTGEHPVTDAGEEILGGVAGMIRLSGEAFRGEPGRCRVAVMPVGRRGRVQLATAAGPKVKWGPTALFSAVSSVAKPASFSAS